MMDIESEILLPNNGFTIVRYRTSGPNMISERL